MLSRILLPAVLLLAAAEARSQPLQRLVVGGDAAVAVPPRTVALGGALQPMGAAAVVASPLPSAPLVALAPAAVAGTGLGAGLAGAMPLLLPVATAATAAVLGGGLPGSGNAGSAPASTR
ncbi:hypothetical protein [Falsiroseomonas tokyonensis]|uniref:Uncharacterized protein n=1 Tax=Falsiroseomonas tokyonensis TaxID=430521 RepID=A0ABV7BS31_9PROT|nr:hypothetical protein [Falsiroseomonas tokyonensis]MBU8538355.1 hypothetical protein [Falsiroseomonas tokyonensis]